MEHPGFKTVFPYPPGQLNHAGGTARHQDVGFGLFQIVYLAIQHLLGQIVMRQGIRSGAAATPVCFCHFPKFHVGKTVEEIPALGFNALSAYRMAGIMVGDHCLAVLGDHLGGALLGTASGQRDQGQDQSQAGAGKFTIPDGGVNLYEVEKQLIQQALMRAGGNQSKASRLLSITRDTLRYKMKKYGLRKGVEQPV